MSGTRKAALAIGVSTAPPLPYLGGAVNGARAFHEWATALGYKSRLVTDEAETPVTMTRLRQELEELLAAAETHRLLIYFAGHGLIREAEEGLWLLSDWHSEQRCVHVDALKRKLYRFRVGQIGIFADACRSLAADMDTADLTRDGILGLGPGSRSATVAVDKYIAAQDGTRTYMIPGSDPADDRCLFSGVLLEGLWGTKPEAFSTIVLGKVTSQSLGSYLQREVPKLADRYELDLRPMVSPTFPPHDDVYFGDDAPVAAPVFPPWPTAAQFAALVPTSIGGVRDALDVAPELLRPRLEDALRQLDRPESFETHAGFVVDGEDVIDIWVPRDAFAQRTERGNWWRIGSLGSRILNHPTPVLIELGSGLFAAATALPDFIASVIVNDQGVTAMVYREIRSGPEVGRATEDALGRLDRGGLRGDEVIDLAVELRQGKHADPVRGTLAAYLYDSIGDVESIRRMAYYYVEHAQAIPYDIALLADLVGERHPDGRLGAAVPRVPARQPRTVQEREMEWTYTATTPQAGVVGGLWPWMRQGWAFLDDPSEDGSTLILPGLIEAGGELTPARFTTFHHAGGQRIAALFQLAPGGVQ